MKHIPISLIKLNRLYLSQMEEDLKNKIIDSLKSQGFYVNGHVAPAVLERECYKQIQFHSKMEQLNLKKIFLEKNFKTVAKYLKSSCEINPSKIKLELREVSESGEMNILFRWWNLVWWSVPYQKAYGRQMRFILWDTYHNTPFGLIGLQSPILKMSVRDNYLKIPKKELDYSINLSMQAQRLGALPPYNEIIGGKMVALTLTSNELRQAYKTKYSDTKTVIKNRSIDSGLLFITTTSAFGRSSLYNRLKYNNQVIAKSLGFTKGSGTFHIPQSLYFEIQSFLKGKGFDVGTTFGKGPSKKVKLLDKAFSLLNLDQFHYHNIKREFYLFELVKNLEEVISFKKEPEYYDRPLEELTDFWIKRWAIKKSQTNPKWASFSKIDFINSIRLSYNLNINYDAELTHKNGA